MSVAGKVVAVTGGAGGIGAAVGRRLCLDGAKVALLDLPSDRLNAVASRIGAFGVGVDVCVEGSVVDAVDEVARVHGRLDAVVVTAGVQLHGADGPAADVPLDVWSRTLAVNLTGAFLTVKHCLRLLVKNSASSIVLIGSPTGLTMSGAGYTAYAASKAGMMSLSRTVAADYAPQGVRANVVVPGTIHTPLIDALVEDPTTYEALLAGTPLGRLGRPEDLTALVSWLVSEDSSFATGAFFAVDGGLTAR